MKELAILDAGPMVASVDRRSPQRAVCDAAVVDARYELLVPAMCLAEAAYLVERDMGSAVEARFIEGIAAFQVVAPEHEDLLRMAELIRQYANFPLGATDASIVALAERLDVRTIITLARRHFSAIRPRHCDRFDVLPG